MNPRESTLLVLLFVASIVSRTVVSAFVLGSGGLSVGHSKDNGGRAAARLQVLSSSEASFVLSSCERRAFSGPRSSRGQDCRGVGGCSMALKFKLKRRRNVPGDFFVDESCVDCDICRWMDPRTYQRSGLGSFVASQPKTEAERMAAFQAMLACPTGSIRTMRPEKQVIDAMASFPLAVDEERLPGIYQLAPCTRESLGTTPYLIVRPEKGNIMIDVPRYLKRTAAKVEALGGVKYLIVTGTNSAVGHEPWKRHFPDMVRILHRLDLVRKTRIMEERLDANGPWYLVEAGRENKHDGYVTGSTARFDFRPVPDEERAPKDRTVKIVGLAGQTRGSVGVVYELECEDGRVERVGFSGGAVGLPSYLDKLDTFPRTVEMDRKPWRLPCGD